MKLINVSSTASSVEFHFVETSNFVKFDNFNGMNWDYNNILVNK
jgi:hypothetical protein